MADAKGLYKTIIIIWSDYNLEASGLTLEDLAWEAIYGDSYCSDVKTIYVAAPEKDINPPDMDFFFDSTDEG